MRLVRDRSQTHRLLRSADLRLRERPHSRDLILDLETREDLEAILQAVSFATRILCLFLLVHRVVHKPTTNIVEFMFLCVCVELKFVVPRDGNAAR